MSRLGRDYIITGYYTDIYFPNRNIRFIAISDNVDSMKGNDFIMTAFKNVMNEWYAKNTSRKTRAVFQQKGMNGGILSPSPVYGYKKDPDNKNHWLIDEEAAEVVRIIFNMYINNKGLTAIARHLKENKVLSPTAYYVSIGKPTQRVPKDDPYDWNFTSVRTILGHREYCGDIVNFKTYRKSYKSRKALRNSPDNMVIFENVNEPIISRKVYEQAQEILSRHKRVPTKREPDIFQGFLYCADCGARMVIRRGNQKRHTIYLCYNYCKQQQCSTHSIRQEDILELLLCCINQLLADAHSDEEGFARIIHEKVDNAVVTDLQCQKEEIKKLEKRSQEIDTVIGRLYEDRALEKISDERYFKISAAYEAEQKEIKEKLNTLKEDTAKRNSINQNIQDFMQIISKYEQITEITPVILAEFIDKILIHQSMERNQEAEQLVEIFYKGVGNLDS